MVSPARSTKKTFADLYGEIMRLPEGLTGEILEEGVLHVMSRPGKPHRRATRACLAALSGADENVAGTGWWIEIEAEVRLPNDRLVVPDLAGWRVERVPDLPNENPLTVLPDWCCEILSPSTGRDDKQKKLPLLARSGVPWSWLVNPAQRRVEVYQAISGLPSLVTIVQGDERRALPPFDLEIAFDRWWLPGPVLAE